MKRPLVAILAISFFMSIFHGLARVQTAYADEVGARAAVVIDGSNDRILYGKNPHWKLPPASTTKLVTAMVTLDRISPDTIITISENAAGTPSVLPHLRAGERFTIRDVLSLALMRSVNGAAVALAEAVAGSESKFVGLMNEKAAALGADNTRFINATGLPGPDQHITAFDLAKVMKAALDYPLIRETITTRTKGIRSIEGRFVFVKNTDQLLWIDDDLIGGKTGYTRAARHCFVCAAHKGGNTLITAVLGESVRDDLWHDSQILLGKGYDVITQKTEPMIYFSTASEKPIVYASYKRSRAIHVRRIARHAKEEVLTADKDGVSTAKKIHKKKRSGHLKFAKKSKKAAVRNLS